MEEQADDLVSKTASGPRMQAALIFLQYPCYISAFLQPLYRTLRHIPEKAVQIHIVAWIWGDYPRQVMSPRSHGHPQKIQKC